MVEIVFSKTFRQDYSSRILPSLKLTDRFIDRVKQFSQNPSNPILNDHPLRGQMNEYRAFSVTGDIRIVYRIIDDQVVKFLNIGTHNQVYNK